MFLNVLDVDTVRDCSCYFDIKRVFRLLYIIFMNMPVNVIN